MVKSEFKFDNIDAWSRKLRDPKLIGVPLRRALSRSALHAAGETRKNTPVDTGRLRNSMTTEVDSSPIPKFAIIGTNVKYGPAVEEGTVPHFPPPSALQPWAVRHGFPPGSAGAFLVGRAIAKRGTKGHHMLRDGLDSTKKFFRQQLKTAAREIEREFRRIR